MVKNNKKLICLIDNSSLPADYVQLICSYASNDDAKVELYLLDKQANNNKADGSSIEFNRTEAGKLESITFTENPTKWSKRGFRYLHEDVKKNLARQHEIDQFDYEKLLILRDLSNDKGLAGAESESDYILITQNESILAFTKEDKQDPFIKDVKTKILNMEFGKVRIDGFLKARAMYCIAPNFTTSKWLWYLYSAYTNVPNMRTFRSVIYNENNSFIKSDEVKEFTEALLTRVKDLIRTMDIILNMDSRDVDNDTLEDLIYYFNYWATLYCGLLDTLALIFQSVYGVGKNLYNNQIGLRKGFALLDFIEIKDPELSSLLQSRSEIISCVYNMRNIIIHREQLTGITEQNNNTGFKRHSLKITDSIKNDVLRLQAEVKQVYKTDLDFGIIIDKSLPRIVPRQFVLAGTVTLLRFIDEYLDILISNNKLGLDVKDVQMDEHLNIFGGASLAIKVKDYINII